MTRQQRVAVIGAGISGLTAAYVLRQTHRVTLFEQQGRLGGHTHTHFVDFGTDGTSVDSGFIVLNDRTYPRVNRLLGELGVRIKPTEMSMGIACEGCGLSYVGGRGAPGIFAQRRRLADPRFLRLLTQVARFQKAALVHLETDRDSTETYGQFLAREGFSTYFTRHYALPIVACVWSTGQRDALEYPAAYLFAFLSNHGFLRLRDAPQWYVVEGGSRIYVDKIAALLGDVRIGCGVVAVARKDGAVLISDDQGRQLEFDRVVIATHADQALNLLSDPTADEFDVLGSFGYASNTTQLHRDESLLRARVAERASWNFRLASCDEQSDRVRVSYWMNRLQGLDPSLPLVVTLNDAERVDPDAVIATMEYAHPIFTPAAIEAQRRLSSLNTARTAYAGAYHGWGFHEDGCRSGVAAAEHFEATW